MSAKIRIRMPNILYAIARGIATNAGKIAKTKIIISCVVANTAFILSVRFRNFVQMKKMKRYISEKNTTIIGKAVHSPPP